MVRETSVAVGHEYEGLHVHPRIMHIGESGRNRSDGGVPWEGWVGGWGRGIWRGGLGLGLWRRLWARWGFMMYSLGKVGVMCKGMGVRAIVGGQGCGCDLGGGLWVSSARQVPS